MAYEETKQEHGNKSYKKSRQENYPALWALFRFRFQNGLIYILFFWIKKTKYQMTISKAVSQRIKLPFNDKQKKYKEVYIMNIAAFALK